MVEPDKETVGRAERDAKLARLGAGMWRGQLSVDASKIIVADDDAAVRRALRAVFVDEGYDVVEVANGTEALRILNEAADGRAALPGALVLDVCMPGFSGLWILGALRRLELDVPTVVVTAFPDPSIDALAERLGAFRVLHKPLDLEALRMAVRDADAAARSRRNVG